MTITQARVLEVLNYDPVTGLFAYKSGRGNGGTHTKDGYLQLKVDGAIYFAHRLAWLYVHGQWPADQIDHRNGVRGYNRIANLREASPSENAQNKGVRVGTASRFPGVVWHERDKRWQAQIRKDGRLYYLGGFADEASAARAYVEAKAKLHEFQPIPRNMG